VRRDPVVEWECRLCGQVFFVPYRIVQVHAGDQVVADIKPDLADLFAHKWMHEAKGQAFP
jgi:hypothetical protein